MRVLADRHHSDLLYGLQRLFEDRLNIDLFVPIGHDNSKRGWWGESYWRFGEVWGDDRLARQFLAINDAWREVEPGLYLTFDQCHPERPLYGVTLEWARKHSWNYVLATVQDNQAGFHRFARESRAKYLYHVGNARQWIDKDLNPIVLDCQQEFDYETIFRYRTPERINRVVSFVNLLAKISESWKPFERLSKLLPYEFRSFGHDCPNGFLTPVAAIAEEMAHAGWAYHDKPTGDGFGHIIHNWASVGRPLIGHAKYYKDQRAEVFWQDMITCIDLDKHPIEEVADIVKSMPFTKYKNMCSAIRDVLDSVYDPEREAKIVSTKLGL